MNFIEAFQNKNRNILVPMLQRDYVQGSREDIINPFLDALTKNEKDKPCDLNYIYGYDEGEGADLCFVPIDGQQRLITLWLFHLYVAAKRKEEFKVELKFISREFAHDFCVALKSNLSQILEESFEGNLSEKIVDQPWFLRSWRGNETIGSMLKTLSYLHQKNVNEYPTAEFAFLELGEEKGLDDDIYVKMNGRGRALSPFENLKSWMDQRVSNLPIAEEWKRKMDNEWTDMFWTNRNRKQDKPEEIDDEQLFCFYNFLILFHANDDELTKTVEDISEKNPDQYDELLQFLGVDKNKQEDRKAKSVIGKVKIFEKLLNGVIFPLVWIERLNLMPDEFFTTAKEWMNELTEKSEKFNGLDLYIGEDKNTSKTYQIAMCKGSYTSTLPLLYALLAYKKGKTPMADWMRTLRNLIFNTEIGREKLAKVEDSIEKLSKKATDNDLYELLNADNETIEILNSCFKGSQVEEEKQKAISELLSYRDEMKRLENGPFFIGHIRVLLDFLTIKSDEKDKKGYDTWSECAGAYVSTLLEVFDGNWKGLNTKYDFVGGYDEHSVMRRALMTFPPYSFGVWYKFGWCFCSNKEEWQKYVNSDNSINKDALRLLIQNVLAPAVKSNTNLLEALKNYVKNLPKDIKDYEKSYVYYFVNYPSVWDYMGKKKCLWFDNNDYDIKLLTKYASTCRKRDLRIFCLNRDFETGKLNGKRVKSPDSKIWDRWCPEPAGKEKGYILFTCQKNIELKGEKRWLKIEVYYNHDDDATSEDDYKMSMYISASNNQNSEQNKQDNIDFFEPKKKELEKQMSCKIENDGYGYAPKNKYSKSEIVDMLNKVTVKLTEMLG